MCVSVCGHRAETCFYQPSPLLYSRWPNFDSIAMLGRRSGVLSHRQSRARLDGSHSHRPVLIILPCSLTVQVPDPDSPSPPDTTRSPDQPSTSHGVELFMHCIALSGEYSPSQSLFLTYSLRYVVICSNGVTTPGGGRVVWALLYWPGVLCGDSNACFETIQFRTEGTQWKPPFHLPSDMQPIINTLIPPIPTLTTTYQKDVRTLPSRVSVQMLV